MSDTFSIDKAIAAASRECRPPWRPGRSFEEQSVAWIIQEATDKALVAVFKQLTERPEIAGELWNDPDYVKKFREKLVARVEKRAEALPPLLDLGAESAEMWFRKDGGAPAEQ